MYKHDEMLQRIKIRKKELHITNEALANATNISLGTLNKILSGESKDPQISSIIKISQALDISTDYIVFGQEAAHTDFTVSEKEHRLVTSYRAHPEMQPAVNKLLNIADAGETKRQGKTQ